MKVTHKKFIGGYRFKKFEGQPQAKVVDFLPSSKVETAIDEITYSDDIMDYLKSFDLTFKRSIDQAIQIEDVHIPKESIGKIVINMIEVEPYDFPMDIFFEKDYANDFTQGLKILKDKLSNVQIHLVFCADKLKKHETVISEIMNIDGVQVSTVVNKYPINKKELLIPTLLDMKYPIGYPSANIGVIMMEPYKIIQLYRYYKEKKPTTHCMVALAGLVWKDNLVLNLPLGTPIKEITNKYLNENMEVRLISNSLMTGPTLSMEDKIDKGTSLLIAIPEGSKGGHGIDTGLHGPVRACISCGQCQNVCPVGLIPHLLHKHVEQGLVNESLANLRIFDCIECNLCNYVCPSKIDLIDSIKKGKEQLEEMELSHKYYQLKGIKEV
jgi:Na+-translocating ferredoxin:NAD+ oxidoreductase RnfC subunit